MQIMDFIQVVMFMTMLGFLTDVSMGDDVACLKAFKASVKDLNGYLASWDFRNISRGGICAFNGVDCWEGSDNRVLDLKLAEAGLSGPFPSGLGSCTSLTGLNLSNNGFCGSLPSDICQQMGFLTSLDLSQNSFSGDLPDQLADCKYLNQLHLQQNQFKGAIPGRIGVLSRLTDLNLSSNALSGQISPSFSEFSAASFANNPELCGPPLASSCSDATHSSAKLPVIGGAVISFALVFVLTSLAIMWVHSCRRRGRAVRFHGVRLTGNDAS